MTESIVSIERTVEISVVVEFQSPISEEWAPAHGWATDRLGPVPIDGDDHEEIDRRLALARAYAEEGATDWRGSAYRVRTLNRTIVTEVRQIAHIAKSRT